MGLTHTNREFDNARFNNYWMFASVYFFLFLFHLILFLFATQLLLHRVPLKTAVIYMPRMSNTNIKLQKKKKKNACSKIYLLLFFLSILLKHSTNYLYFCAQNDKKKERESAMNNTVTFPNKNKNKSMIVDFFLF